MRLHLVSLFVWGVITQLQAAALQCLVHTGVHLVQSPITTIKKHDYASYNYCVLSSPLTKYISVKQRRYYISDLIVLFAPFRDEHYITACFRLKTKTSQEK